MCNWPILRSDLLTSSFVEIVAETGKKSSVKGSKAKKKETPSDGELQEKIRELLKEADFSKVSDGRIRSTYHYILNADNHPV